MILETKQEKVKPTNPCPYSTTCDNRNRWQALDTDKQK